MKTSHIIFSFIILSAIACQSKSGTDTKDETPDASVSETNSPLPAAVCYQNMMGGDTFRLQVKIAGDRATGTLAYRFSQKDSSHGNIDGTMHGDTLYAMYTYLSEGSRSQREVAFLLTPAEAQEGYGQLEEKDRIMRFSTRKGIQFGNLLRMKQLPCDGQPFDGLRVGQK